ncbi:MAG: ACP S-malonyltransferase [Propionibacteriaceae bacterium]|nr:ACP S-malonyltransferase [Propionibacteriaceae bacterium]
MGRVAVVFAGQGAQTPGMGEQLSVSSPAARSVFDRAEAVWPPVRDLCFTGPQEQLNITANTQPCLFVVDLACARALEEAGVRVDGVAGFSLGEVAAACFASLFDQDHAFDFVRQRADAMHACGEENPGTMFAVLKLSSSQVEEVCSTLDQVYAVNYNCPGQTVVACATSSADSVRQAMADAGGKAIPLAVSGAFHSPLMDDAAARLREVVADMSFSPPAIPIYANMTGALYTDPKALLSNQVNHPVRWEQTIRTMIADGFDTFIEVGPGTTLTGFIRKIDENVRTASVRDDDSLTRTLEVLHD